MKVNHNRGKQGVDAVCHPLNIREEELKNRVAAMFFGKYDCTRIVGNIDFCVSPKRRDPRQMTFIPDTPILWAEAKNHPTDIYRMLAQLILTIKGELKGDIEPPRFLGCFDSEKIAFVEYHYVLPVFNLNDFNWTQTPSAVDDKTVATVRGKAKMNSESSDGKYTELLANLKAAMKNLAARIEPKVYEYGFLKW